MSRSFTETVSRESLEYIRRMAYIAEYHTPGLKNHLERIRSYCSLIAHGLNLSTQEVELISFASQLHDIGVISIPESILLKADSLTDDQWEMMRRHPIIGAEILHGSTSPLLQTGEIIALSHHERWDGSGYPYGLKGEEIPLSGRICAVADVFDALTSSRPYKTAIPVADALSLMVDSEGQLFDPELVEIFANSSIEIVKTREFTLSTRPL